MRHEHDSTADFVDPLFFSNHLDQVNAAEGSGRVTQERDQDRAASQVGKSHPASVGRLQIELRSLAAHGNRQSNLFRHRTPPCDKVLICEHATH